MVVEMMIVVSELRKMCSGSFVYYSRFNKMMFIDMVCLRLGWVMISVSVMMVVGISGISILCSEVCFMCWVVSRCVF